MVEHAAVNRGVVGSSPTSGAIFSNKIEVSGISDTISTPNRPLVPPAEARWPLKVRHRKNGPVLARVYSPCEGRESYRVAWPAAGRRQMRSFPRFAGIGGARESAENLTAELTQGSQVPFLSPKQAQDALAIRDLLADLQMETGRRVSAVEAVIVSSPPQRPCPSGP